MRKHYPKIINALIILCLLITGCVLPDKSAPIKPADYRETIRVACVGDSITYGNSIKYRLRDCYPAQLGRLLGGKSWLIAQDQETGRATFVSAGADNADLSLGDEVTAMAEDLGLTPPNVLSS